MQVGLVVLGDGADPGVEFVAAALGEDDGNGGDVCGEAVQVGAAGADGGDAGLVVGFHALRVA
ncbi:hypothetical protein GCM10010170_077720 [Dactylosporangium salmoneum]|uniref:Uncharacterized protein n=1 Tax=Dactylosporangium salmoneum TaxID=53361 RepID=A0ABN3HAX4_9ACTN